MSLHPGRSTIVILSLLIGMLVTRQPHAQTAQGRLEFAVASVKRGSTSATGGRISLRPGGVFEAVDATVRYLIQEAYGVKGFQVLGGPSWMGTERFTVTAKARVESAGTPFAGRSPQEALAEADLMLRTLLEDRFHLQLHRETRQLPIYALTVAKNGIKLVPAKEGNCAVVDSRPDTPPGPRPLMPCGQSWMGANQRNRTFDGVAIQMTDVIRALSNVTGRVVVDRTAFTGTFDLHLEWTPDSTAAASSQAGETRDLDAAIRSTEANAVSIFTALQEQLGLKLESDKGPVDVVVIDRVEHPAEN